MTEEKETTTLRREDPVDSTAASAAASAADSYAARLSDCGHKGQLNLANAEDPADVVAAKSRVLAHLLRDASHAVLHTGAGISTPSGIADFRGPRGVWTLERKRRPRAKTVAAAAPADAVPAVGFEQAAPTIAHAAMAALVRCGVVKFVVSQNVDGLHWRSGLPRDKLAELHGNVFVEKCEECGAEYFRDFEMDSVGFAVTGRRCDDPRCGGVLRDSLLDWHDELPERDLTAARDHSGKSDLAVVLGSSLQMMPATSLPLMALKNPGRRFALCNLSRTSKDKDATLVVRATADEVLARVVRELDLKLPLFERHVLVRLDVLQGSDDDDDHVVEVCVSNVDCPEAGARGLRPFAASVTVTVGGNSFPVDLSTRSRATAKVKAPPTRGTVVVRLDLREPAPQREVNLVHDVSAESSEHSVCICRRDFAEEAAELLRQRDRVRSRHSARLVNDEPEIYFHKSLKRARFSKCVLCGEETSATLKRRHLSSCPRLISE